MFGICHQTHPSTVVEKAVEGHFLSLLHTELCVARNEMIEIYRLVSRPAKASALNNGSIASGAAGATHGEEQKSHKLEHLELIYKESLHGCIEDVAKVSTTGKLDSLLLAFRDYKVSLVAFDPSTYMFETLSMHMFEDDEIKEGQVSYMHKPILAVDPSNTVAVMLCYGKILAVLPFTRNEVDVVNPEDEENLEKDESTIKETKKTSVGINLRQLRSHVIYPVHEDDGRLRGIRNIRDITFLEAYFNPTLAILYEDDETWAGRLAVREDTCNVIAMTIPTDAGDMPQTAFHYDKLPFDCYRLMTVPAPRGGVLAFAPNSLLYLSQNTTPYGVSLNTVGQESTSFALEAQPGIVATLEDSVSLFVDTDTMLLSLTTGDILIVGLHNDSGRNVPCFEMRKTIASVIPSCLSMVGPFHIFLGSRMGDSLLISFFEEIEALVPVSLQTQEESEFEAKRNKKEPDDLEDFDDDFLVFKDEKSDSRTKSYSFKVVDTLVNIGPIIKLDIGERSYLSEEYRDSVEYDLQMVTCSGYGKNGALCVLEDGIRPQVIHSTTAENFWADSIWSVYGPPVNNELPVHHQYLFMSQLKSTMVFSTGESFNNILKSDFNTKEKSLHVCNICQHQYILQVFPSGFQVLQKEKSVSSYSMEAGLEIVACSASDLLLSLVISDGSLRLFEFAKDNKYKMLPFILGMNSSVTSVHLFTDEQRVFQKQDLNVQTGIKRTKEEASDDDGHDSDDDFLYGNEMAEDIPKQVEKEIEDVKEQLPVETYLFLTTDAGYLEIYRVSDGMLVFSVKEASMGPRTLRDNTEEKKIEKRSTIIVELLVLDFQFFQNDIIFMALTNNSDFFIYQSFFYVSPEQDETHLKVRFRKINHDIILRKMDEYEDEFAALKRKRDEARAAKQSKDSNAKKATDQSKLNVNNKNEKKEAYWLTAVKTTKKRLNKFKDLHTYAGVFVTGPKPWWIMCTRKGLRFHPMHVDFGVKCFTSFRNVQVPNGFIYFNEEDTMRICQLQLNMQYNTHFPMRKVQLRSTPHFLAYHPQSKTLVMAISKPVTIFKKARATNSEEDMELIKKGERYIYPTERQFEIILVTPYTWEIIDRFEFPVFEHLSSLKVVQLTSEEVAGGLKSSIAVASVQTEGEDVAAKGMIHLFDIVEVNPEPGKPHTTRKFKNIFSKPQVDGPVTSICSVSGQLISASGQKVFAWLFRNDKLVGKAFIDTLIYSHCLESAKEFILVADIKNSITLLRYREAEKSLSYVAKDPDEVDVMSVSFVVDDSTLAFMVSDIDSNIQILCFAPGDVASREGTRLLKRADFHVSGCINSFVRVDRRILPGEEYPRPRQANVFGTTQGGIGYFLPLDEKQFKRLAALQSKMNTKIQHFAGLNPRGFRLARPYIGNNSQPARNILDGGLLFRYVNLPISERRSLALQAGSEESKILQDLQEIQHCTSIF